MDIAVTGVRKIVLNYVCGWKYASEFKATASVWVSEIYCNIFEIHQHLLYVTWNYTDIGLESTGLCLCNCWMKGIISVWNQTLLGHVIASSFVDFVCICMMILHKLIVSYLKVFSIWNCLLCFTNLIWIWFFFIFDLFYLSELLTCTPLTSKKKKKD